MKKYLILLLLISALAGCAAPVSETPQPSIPAPVPTTVATPEPEVWSPPVYPPYTPPPILEEPSYIPQELVDLAAQAVESNTLNEVFSPLEVGRNVSDEELLSIMDGENQPEGIWDWLRLYVDSESSLFMDHIVIEADGDNDGILDLIAVTTDGSAGNTGLEFFQGQAEGGYQKAYQVYNFLWRSSFGFTSFEGKQYFWNTELSHETKSANGISFYEFQKGVPVESVSIFREVSGYEEDMRQGEVFYTDKLTEMTFEVSSDQFAGTAERREEDRVYYWGDLDNDGVEEYYLKNTWCPTTFWDVHRIHFQYEDGYEGQAVELLNIMNEHGYEVQTLWCDKEEQGNVVYTISRDGGDALSSDAWQYQETMWVHLAQVLFAPQYTVKTRAHTQDLNIDFLDTKAFM